MTHSLLRSLIREALLTEEVYGAQAVVYHGTNADPVQFVSALLNDEFQPGKGAGSMYGKGLYTVYDLKGTQTERGGYGLHIIKLKLNLYGYIIFDPEVALKVYKAPLSIVEQAQEVGADEDTVEKLRSVKIDPSNFTSATAEFASIFLKGRVKGIVYTDSFDGRCAVVYDPTTAVPVAWKNVRDRSWTPVDRSSIKPALRRSAGGGWQEGKYETDSFKVLKKLAKLPIDQRVVNGNLELDAPIASLPDGLRVGGSLYLGSAPITSLPEGLKVGGDLYLDGTSIKLLPRGLQVGGDLYLDGTSIDSIPAGLSVGGNLNLAGTLTTSLSPDLSVGGDLNLADTPIKSLPGGLQVGASLNVSNTLIKSLPAELKVGGNLILHGAPIRLLPADLTVKYYIFGFSGDKSQIPAHLRSKIA
jgi:hypothetical protein